MAFLPAALAAASAVAGGVSEFSAGQYQAAIAKRNAEIATQNAGKISDAAQMKAQLSDREGAALEGSQLADQGASGLTGASQYFLRQQTADSYAQDRTNITLEGLAGSREQLQQAANYRAAASQARTQAWFGLAKGLLSAGDAAAGGGRSGGVSLLGSAKSSTSAVGARIGNGG